MSKLFTVIFAMFTMFAAFIAKAQGSLNYKDAQVLNRFSTWMNRFNIESRDELHLGHIFDNWILNDKYIEEVNSLNLTYTLGHNAFSGMDSQEFSQYMGFVQNKETGFKGLRGAVTFEMDEVFDVSALPSSLDWRSKGAVTPVKNQQSCGSCYSFSTTGALEGAYQLKYGNLISFSEQQIVDCSTLKNNGPNLGCNGGQISLSAEWVGKNGGLCTESAYPYVSGTTKTAGTCQKTCSLVSGSKITSSVAVAANSDTAMMTALTKQPVSVAIEADQRSFQMYAGGIFSGSCGTSLDHAVLLVGYGTDSASGLDYYILKNSWGTSWGSSGYVYLGKGNDPVTGKPYNGGKGQCGVLMEASYPTL